MNIAPPPPRSNSTVSTYPCSPLFLSETAISVCVVLNCHVVKITCILIPRYSMCLLVCLFVWGLSSNPNNLHTFGDVTISGERLQILSYARADRHSWSLSSGGSLTCHTYCDKDLPIIILTTEEP